MLASRKKSLLIASGVVAMALVAFSFFKRGEEGPVYQGHTLEKWLMIQRNATVSSPEATKAIREIGTNALPFALRWITEDDTPVDEATPTRPELSVAIFRTLGPAAAPAIPELRSLALSERRGAARAVTSLIGIGPEALPVVFSIITNTNGNADFRYGAVNMLGNLGTNLSLAFPTLLSCLDDPNKHVVLAAANLLIFDLKPKDKTFLPVLIKMLEHPDVALRLRAIKGISDFGKEGLPAMPALAKRLDDEDPTVRSRAARLLHTMAPDVYTNSPSKKLRDVASPR